MEQILSHLPLVVCSSFFLITCLLGTYIIGYIDGFRKKLIEEQNCKIGFFRAFFCLFSGGCRQPIKHGFQPDKPLDTTQQPPGRNDSPMVYSKPVKAETNLSPIKQQQWQTFRATGLPLLVNQFLHIFGWAIVFEIDQPSNEITTVYPARVKFRGFDEKTTSEAYRRVSKYMVDNAIELKQEAYE